MEAGLHSGIFADNISRSSEKKQRGKFFETLCWEYNFRMLTVFVLARRKIVKKREKKLI